MPRHLFPWFPFPLGLSLVFFTMLSSPQGFQKIEKYIYPIFLLFSARRDATNILMYQYQRLKSILLTYFPIYVHICYL